jgi:hypothetical protein
MVGTMPNVICPFVDNDTDTFQTDCSINFTSCTVGCVEVDREH